MRVLRVSAVVLPALLAALLALISQTPVGASEAMNEGLRVGMLELVNELRLNAGSAALEASDSLAAAAQVKADRLAADSFHFETRHPQHVAEMADLADLPELLAGAGYEARRVKAHVVVADSALTPEGLLATSLRLEEDLLEGGFGQVGIGIAIEGELSIVVLICALSVADEFEVLTDGLGDLKVVRMALFERTNEARRSDGRGSVRRDPCLERVAQGYAESMLAGGFYGHVAPDGGAVDRRTRAAGCGTRKVGENLAQGQPTPDEVMEDWLDSPGHRQNLLDRDYDRVGFGLAFGPSAGDYRILWVQVLAKE